MSDYTDHLVDFLIGIFLFIMLINLTFDLFFVYRNYKGTSFDEKTLVEARNVEVDLENKYKVDTMSQGIERDKVPYFTVKEYLLMIASQDRKNAVTYFKVNADYIDPTISKEKMHEWVKSKTILFNTSLNRQGVVIRGKRMWEVSIP